MKKVISGRALFDMRCLQKVFFVGFPAFPQGGLVAHSRVDCYISFFCLRLVRHVLSDCCMSCFVLSRWSHIDVSGVVKLCTVYGRLCVCWWSTTVLSTCVRSLMRAAFGEVLLKIQELTHPPAVPGKRV